MLNTFLRAVRASGVSDFVWYPIDQFVSTLHEASPRTVILASPHILRYFLTGGEGSIQRLAAAAARVPHTQEIAQSMVDTLLQIASERDLAPHIPASLWSWVSERPSLPPVCRGREVGTRTCVVRAVRELRNVTISKSYLLVVWSERGALALDSFQEMFALVCEGFGGIEMGRHQRDLIQHLNHVLRQLDQQLERFPSYHDLRETRRWYQKLMDLLVGMNAEAIASTSYSDDSASPCVNWGGHI